MGDSIRHGYSTQRSATAAKRIRILLLADTHIGFDLPERPRIQRRLRGHDFFANSERVLATIDCETHRGSELEWEFRELPARAMMMGYLNVERPGHLELRDEFSQVLSRVPEDAVLQLRLRGNPPDDARVVVATEYIRRLAPPTMNLEVALADDTSRQRWMGTKPCTSRSRIGP